QHLPVRIPESPEHFVPLGSPGSRGDRVQPLHRQSEADNQVGSLDLGIVGNALKQAGASLAALIDVPPGHWLFGPLAARLALDGRRLLSLLRRSQTISGADRLSVEGGNVIDHISHLRSVDRQVEHALQWTCQPCAQGWSLDRKSTRLNSSHVKISYAVFCLKKTKTTQRNIS